MIRTSDYRPLFDAVKAFRNGLVYGVRVRAPHTLVLSLVWGKGLSPWQILEKVASASKQHGLNLGMSAACFQLLHGLMGMLLKGRTTAATTGCSPTLSSVLATFLCGAVAGSLFWGERNPINTQVSMYLLSRVLSGLLWHVMKRSGLDAPPAAFRTFTAVMWGLVMVLFVYDPDSLQSSLQSSLHYIYRDSTKYSGWYDLIAVNDAGSA